jgi:GAF domain-containing protein
MNPERVACVLACTCTPINAGVYVIYILCMYVCLPVRTHARAFVFLQTICELLCAFA